jgi:hypothetical protein
LATRILSLLLAWALIILLTLPTSAGPVPIEGTVTAAEPRDALDARGRTVVLAMILTCVDEGNLNSYLRYQTGLLVHTDERDAWVVACT